MFSLKSKIVKEASTEAPYYVTDLSALIYWRDEAEDAFEGYANFGGSYAPSPHDRRKMMFLQHDPVHTTNLMAFMKEHLALVQNKMGGVDAFREFCMRNVDEALVDQMRTMLL